MICKDYQEKSLKLSLVIGFQYGECFIDIYVCRTFIHWRVHGRFYELKLTRKFQENSYASTNKNMDPPDSEVVVNNQEYNCYSFIDEERELDTHHDLHLYSFLEKVAGVLL